MAIIDPIIRFAIDQDELVEIHEARR